MVLVKRNGVGEEELNIVTNGVGEEEQSMQYS